MEETLKQILQELKEIRREMATKQDISEINNKIRYVNRRVADVELEFQGIKQQ